MVFYNIFAPMTPSPFKLFLSFLFLFPLVRSNAQKMSISPSSLVFNTPVLTTAADSITFSITNNGCGFIKIEYAYCPDRQFYLTDSSSFWLAPSATKTMQLKFSPNQNIQYKSVLVFHTTAGEIALPLSGKGKFIESYYDSTFNKFDEGLKLSLNALLASNYTSYSYNAARDKMFMEFDNKKINGQGAVQNTLECIYTGRLAVGYASRSACQTNDNFNTEHTWPQSFFGSALPMVSDLNHLFPTDDVANNYRANNPFGMVSNPVYNVGGSKGIPTLFEPRDAQKGRTARAMLYFAIRYNNPAYGLVTFFGPQEAVLRSWCMQFLPDSIDRKRNNDIFGYQKNRNPFIDHPEFLERITSIANNSVAPLKLTLWCDTQNISKNYFLYDTMDYKISLLNTGNATITMSKIQFTGNTFNISNTSTVIPGQSVKEISIKKVFSNTGSLTDTLVIENNSTNHSIIRIPISININTLHVSATKTGILYANDSAILSLNTSGAVSWNNGSTGKTLVVKNAGNYFATVTDSSGCHQTDSINIRKAGAGLNPKDISTFILYPNPANTFIYLRNMQNSEMLYTLINSLGAVVMAKPAAPHSLIYFDLSNFSNGIYFLQDERGEGRKIIVVR